MDMKKRATSAGYRLPDPRNVTQSSLVSMGPSKIHNTGASKDSNPETRDPVKQDQVWREFVHAEMKGAKEWQKNWSFLKNYDQLGELRSETPLPSHVSLYSDHLPHTANQMLGSRLYTQLGMELVRMDKLLLLSRSHHKCKQSLDLLSC
ncbi:uncharacterized protein C2orf50 homolog [Osmerus mordax]|uniref:uncharacterized protein C2orf50 homolog n=1 Tax=Osmerus mordax TaxID=8014 RepID=UPI00350F8AF9